MFHSILLQSDQSPILYEDYLLKIGSIGEGMKKNKTSRKLRISSTKVPNIAVSFAPPVHRILFNMNNNLLRLSKHFKCDCCLSSTTISRYFSSKILLHKRKTLHHNLTAENYELCTGIPENNMQRHVTNPRVRYVYVTSQRCPKSG